MSLSRSYRSLKLAIESPTVSIPLILAFPRPGLIPIPRQNEVRVNGGSNCDSLNVAQDRSVFLFLFFGYSFPEASAGKRWE